MGAFPYTPDLGITKVGLGRPNMSPIVWYDDFGATGVTQFSATRYGAPYLVVGTNAAVTANTTLQYIAGDGGKVKFISTATSGDAMVARLDGAPFVFNSSTSDPRPLECSFKATIDTITTSTQIFGFGDDTMLTTADPITTQTVGAAFSIVSGVLSYGYKTSAVTVAPTAFSPAVSVVAAQVIELGIKWDGIDKLQFLKDGVVLQTFGLATFTSTAVSPCFGIKTSSAATKAVTTDWGYMAQEPAKAGR